MYNMLLSVISLFLSGSAKKMTIVQSLFLQQAPYNIEGHYFHFHLHIPRPAVHEKAKEKTREKIKERNKREKREEINFSHGLQIIYKIDFESEATAVDELLSVKCRVALK